MNGYLLDVNALVALLWPAHESHSVVQNWFARDALQGWATCPFTQAGFVRIVSNPAFSRDAIAPQQAVKLLAANVKQPFHRFWPDDISLEDAVRLVNCRLVGHRQVTDAYLLGLAIHHGGRLATLDRSALGLVAQDSPERCRVEVVGP